MQGFPLCITPPSMRTEASTLGTRGLSTEIAQHTRENSSSNQDPGLSQRWKAQTRVAQRPGMCGVERVLQVLYERGEGGRGPSNLA